MAAGARTRPVWAVWLWVRAANPAARGRGGTKKSEAEIIDCVCGARARPRGGREMGGSGIRAATWAGPGLSVAYWRACMDYRAARMGTSDALATRDCAARKPKIFRTARGEV